MWLDRRQSNVWARLPELYEQQFYELSQLIYPYIDINDMVRQLGLLNTLEKLVLIDNGEVRDLGHSN